MTAARDCTDAQPGSYYDSDRVMNVGGHASRNLVRAVHSYLSHASGAAAPAQRGPRGP
jgi:hypothetical protein